MSIEAHLTFTNAKLTASLNDLSREWPTVPQLYVNGEFIGGSDIVTAMHESGELKDILKEPTSK
jgi:monothiol glutaredoxin